MLLKVLLLVGLTTAFPHESILLNPGGIGGIFKGPNSETIVKGPDGSVITSDAIGGEVEVPPKKLPVVVVKEESLAIPITPVVVEEKRVPEVYVEKIVEHVATPLLLDEKIVAVRAPEGVDLVGPSGVVSTRDGHSVVSGPASTSIDGKEVLQVPALEKVLPIIPEVAKTVVDSVVNVATAKVLPEILSNVHNIAPKLVLSGTINHTPIATAVVEDTIPYGHSNAQVVLDANVVPQLKKVVPEINSQRLVPNVHISANIPQVHEVLLPSTNINAHAVLPFPSIDAEIHKDIRLDAAVLPNGNIHAAVENIPVLVPEVPKILPAQYGTKYVL